MRKAILVAAALTAMMSAPVLAQTYRAANDGGPMASASTESVAPTRATPAHAAYARDYDTTPAAPGVISYDRYAGWDPDPSIRLELMRDPNGGDSQ